MGRLDLATEWRARRWRKLLNVIDGLPRNSAYVEAVANDEQLAEQLAAQPEPPGGSARRMSEWSPVVELLTAILDRQGELIQAIAVLGRAKPGRIRPGPRPVTALDRVRKRRRIEAHEALVARVLPRPPQPATTGD